MDNHATTPLDPRVLEEMLPYFTEHIGNASSIDHPYGAKAHDAVEKAREQVAKTINAKPEEIIFTSGATESDNLALQGVAKAYSSKGKHIITTTVEHMAILDTCKYLEEQGWRITYIPVDKDGIVNLEKLEDAITSETVLISVIFGNNEVGTISPVKEIGKIAKEHTIFFHTDGAQATGHIPVDVEKMGIDMMSMSSHKLYGPKGIGALYIKRHNPRIKPQPTIFGGGQERGLRSGTYNVPGIVGMGQAFEIAAREMEAEGIRLSNWTRRMRMEFMGTIEGAEQNGHPERKLPHNLNMFFPMVESKALVLSINKHLAISSGSACTTELVEPSHVIVGLGYSATRAHSSIRFGMGRFNKEDEVTVAIKLILEAIARIYKIKI